MVLIKFFRILNPGYIVVTNLIISAIFENVTVCYCVRTFTVCYTSQSHLPPFFSIYCCDVFLYE